MKSVFKVWCEWDIGLNDVVFANAILAWDAAEAAVSEFEDFQEAVDQCLVGVEEIEVICE